MSLLSVLLFATSIMLLLTGVITLIGTSKADKSRGIFFLALAIGCTIWTFGCGGYLALPTDAHDVAMLYIYCIYIGGLILSVSILAYAGWRYKVGKFLTIFSALYAIFLAVYLACDTSALFTGYTLSHAGNSVQLFWGWYYVVYCLFYVIDISAFLYFFYNGARHARTKQYQRGDYLLLFGFLFASILSGVFNLILPPVTYSLIWVGPMSFAVVAIVYFYAALKYRIVSIASHWLRLLAYGVTMLSGVMIYMVIFYLVFTALFKIPNPSGAILALNFLMIVIVLLLVPVINEVNAAVKSAISVGQVDIAYVVKKLNRVASKNVDLRDLAGFLADHLHFSYIGFIINGRLYGSKALGMSSEELKHITHLRSTARGGVWQEPNKSVQKVFDDLGLRAVAELRNAKGRPFGQLVVGKPLGKSTFERRDLIQLEMIINLVAAVVDSEKHIRA